MLVNKLMIRLTINYLVSKFEKTANCFCTNCWLLCYDYYKSVCPACDKIGYCNGFL